MAWLERFKSKKGAASVPEERLSEPTLESAEPSAPSAEMEASPLSAADRAALEAASEPMGDETGAMTAAGSEAEPAEAEPDSKQGLLARFKQGVSKTRQNIGGKIDNLIKSNCKLDDEFFEEMEDILIQADVGVNTTMELVDTLRQRVKKEKIHDASAVRELMIEEISNILGSGPATLNLIPGQLNVILVVGVNGAGKTTSIAKMAYRFQREGRKVVLAAADTFRAAAIDQLQIWADRVGVDLIKHQPGSDPGAVVFDAIAAARARQAEVLIIDTAGRLQNKSNLMKELAKLHKIIDREVPDAPREVLLLLDATTGQNAITQARIFMEATGVNGIILSKLDGTAKGGIVIAIARELKIPVKLIGLGEGLEDLRDFHPELMARALFDDSL